MKVKVMRSNPGYLFKMIFYFNCQYIFRISWMPVVICLSIVIIGLVTIYIKKLTISRSFYNIPQSNIKCSTSPNMSRQNSTSSLNGFSPFWTCRTLSRHVWTCWTLDIGLRLGMAIPRRFSFLEESRSRGMANLHSSGIEEDGIYSSGSLGNFEEWVIQKIIKNLDKHPKNSNKFWKKLKKNSALILYFKVG